MHRIALLATLAMAAPVAAQTVYKCTDANGNPVFSQTPCSPQAEELHLRVIEPTAADRAAAADRLSRPSSVGLDGDERVCMERAHRLAYDGPNRQLRTYRQRLAHLERRTRYTNNNLAGATLEAALREEISGIHQAMATVQMSADQTYQAAAQRCRDERARREHQAPAAPAPVDHD